MSCFIVEINRKEGYLCGLWWFYVLFSQYFNFFYFKFIVFKTFLGVPENGMLAFKN